MSASKKKKSISRVFFAGLLGICLVFTIVPRVKSIVELNQQKEELEKQKIESIEKSQALQEKKTKAESLGNIEKIAREQLGMVKEGESTIIQVVPDE